MAKHRTLIGYGIGDFGLNLYWNSLYLFLLFWYTDVAGISARVAGGLFFVGLLWDAITDPLVASIAQRQRSKWGTYRPFLLYGSGVLAFAFCLLFYIPPLSGPGLILFLAAAHIFFRTAYTLVAVPYSALSSRISFDSIERIELTGYRMFFALLGLLAVSGAWFPLVRIFGEGPDRDAGGFVAASIVAAILATVAILLCFTATQERPVRGTIQGKRPSIVEFWRAVRANDALGRLLVMILMQSSAYACLMVTMAYFIDVNDAVLAPKDRVMTAYAVVTVAAVPVWTLLARRFGKKRCWLWASGIVVLAGCHLAIFGVAAVMGIPVQLAAVAAGMAAFAVLVWSFIPDTVEYGQWRTGHRDEGAVFGSVLMVQKLSGGLVGLAVGNLLAWFSYEPNAAAQAPGVIARISLLLAMVPTVLLALSCLVVLRFPVDRQTHATILEEIGEV